MPKEWITLVPNYENKGDVQDFSNQGIKLMTLIIKLQESVTELRKRRYTQNRLEFTPKRSTLEPIHLMSQ